jgi:hypothetical protein
MKNFLKAWLARNLWDFEAFWRISNETDEMYLKAVETIEDKNMFKNNKINY